MKQLIALLACALTLACADPTQVRLQEGALKGRAAAGVRAFLSVPYGAAPRGALRWRAPQPVTPWLGVRDARAFGPSCVQNISTAGWGPWTGEFSPQGAVSEDCLTLSIWTPANSDGARLPVLFWMPGGGLTDGGEATALYDGAALARQGIVVVVINYRVAAFGTLAHPALEAEPDGAYGNYALRDALGALKWVHDNIAAFGGDSARVTIAGQSAGAALAYILLDAPPARGLFAGAILQSFPPGSETLPDRQTADALGVSFAQALGAANLAELRAAPAGRVLEVSSASEGLNLYVDGVLIGDPQFAAPPFVNDVPIMMGVTADEGSWLRPNLEGHREAIAQNGRAFAALYGATDEAQALDASLKATRESQLVALQRFARAHGRPTYLYLWDHWLPGPNAERYRAFHSSEVVYMFSSLARAPRPFTRQDRLIAQTMMSYWANFVKTGDPNGQTLAPWPRALGQATQIMELGDRFAVLPALAPEVLRYWNERYDARGEYRF